MHISATGYLEEVASCFTKVTEDKKMIEDGRKAETVSDSEEENKKERALRKKKRDARALSLAIACLSLSTSAVSVPESAPPFLSASASASALSVPRLSALLLSALLSASDVSVPVPVSSAFLLSAFPSAFGVSVPMPGLLAPPSVLSVSGVSVPVPRSSAPPSMLSVFGVSVPVPRSLVLLFVSDLLVPVHRLSPLPFPTWSDPQTPTPVPGRQRLSQWSGILKRASSKEAPTTCAPLFPPSERPSPLLFPSSGIGEKRPFDKAFNIDCRPLADDHAGEDVGERKFDKTFINTRPLADNHAEEEVDLSFAGCGCSPGVKLNRL